MSDQWWGECPEDGVVVAETEVDDESYSFHLVQVRRSPDGRLWISNDSGCSCPSPFEDHTESSWTPLSMEAASEATEDHHSPEERVTFLGQIRDLLSPLPVRAT